MKKIRLQEPITNAVARYNIGTKINENLRNISSKRAKLKESCIIDEAVGYLRNVYSNVISPVFIYFKILSNNAQ